jgi:hypothetical protein
MKKYYFSSLLTFMMLFVASNLMANELVIAARDGNFIKVKNLVESGVSVDVKNDYGLTSLAYASMKGHMEVVKYLVLKGANVNNKNIKGALLLVGPAYEGRLEVVKFLVEEHGARIDNNVLNHAIENGGQEMVAYLESHYNPYVNLGVCSVGESVYHREKWNTKTSSGNVIADSLFNAATKEEFVIIFEGIVEGFLGNKVKVIINDYKVEQTQGGGFLQPKTYQGNELARYADKYIGKAQFYEKSRCDKAEE